MIIEREWLCPAGVCADDPPEEAFHIRCYHRGEWEVSLTYYAGEEDPKMMWHVMGPVLERILEPSAVDKQWERWEEQRRDTWGPDAAAAFVEFDLRLRLLKDLDPELGPPQ